MQDADAHESDDKRVEAENEFYDGDKDQDAEASPLLNV